MTRAAALLLGLVLAAGAVGRADPARAAITVGLERGVAEGTDRNRDMRQLGLAAALDLPGRRPLGGSWLMRPRLSLRGGRLTGWGDTGYYGAAGLRVDVTAVRAGVSLEGFAGPVRISRIHFGGADFGGNWQLLTQFGFSTQITRALSLGYRFQHMSNVGLEPSNPGLDTHLFRIEARLGSGR